MAASTTSRLLFAALSIALTAIPLRADTPPKPRLAATPPMGWNSWEAFRREFDEDSIKAQADAMVSTGLRDAGFNYLVIDGGWKPASRAPDGTLIADPAKFPHGIKALADYVHTKGLKFGLHQPAGIHDCPKLSPGSQNFEDRDAALFASWGVDFIKYDQCDYIHAANTTPGSPDLDRITLRQADTILFSTEAEAAQNKITGLARVQRRDTCSGGRCVAGIGYDNAALTIPDLPAPAAGHYTLDVHYSNPYFGQNKDRFKSTTFFLTVNDAPPRRVDLPYNMAERYTPGLISLDVDLHQGANTIIFNNPTSQEEDVRLSYVKMATALNRTGRPILFSTSGAPRPWLWSSPIAHLYRTAGDVVDRWTGNGNTIPSILDRHLPLIDAAAPESWPDPDMLEVGHKDKTGRPKAANPAMTDAEYRAQFSLWCMMNAPLFISMDLRKIEDATKTILLNHDVIAIDQDPLANPCRIVRSVGDQLILAKPLANHDLAVAFLNRASSPAAIQIPLADLNLPNKSYTAKDLWTSQSSTLSDGTLQAQVPSHSVVLLRLSP